MKRALFAAIAAAVLAAAASADLVSLVSGKKYQGAVIEWGGVVVDVGAAASVMRLLASDDGASWTALAETPAGPAGRRWLRTAEGDGRFVRIEVRAAAPPILRADHTNPRPVRRAPLHATIVTGSRPPRKISRIFEPSPKPSQMTVTGISADFGIG